MAYALWSSVHYTPVKIWLLILAKAIDPEGNETNYSYDGVGNIIKVENADGTFVQYSYDKNYRLTDVWDEGGAILSYAYDGNGNLVQKTDEDGYVTEYSYGPRNLVDAINYGDGREVQFAYDKNGELVAMMDWNGTVNFSLDLLGRIASVNDHNEKVTVYVYDETGNKTAMTYPDNTAAAYAYDLLDRLTVLTDAEDQVTTYAYDAASRLAAQSRPNGWDDAYQYDAAGQLLRQLTTDPSNEPGKAVEWLYAYDAEGNILTEYRDGELAKHGLDSSMHGMERYSLAHTYDALNRLA